MRDLLDDDDNLDIIDPSGNLREDIRDMVPPLTNDEWDRIVENVRENAPHGDLGDVYDAIRDALREVEEERGWDLVTVVSGQPARGGAHIFGGASSQRFAQGTWVRIVAVASPGYEFTGWSVVGGITEYEGNTADTRFRMPAGNVTLTANFAAATNPGPCGNYPCTCADDLLYNINEAARENDDERMRDLLDDDDNLDIIDESGDLRDAIRDIVPPLTNDEWDRIVENVRETAPHGDLEDVYNAIRDALREIEEERGMHRVTVGSFNPLQGTAHIFGGNSSQLFAEGDWARIVAVPNAGFRFVGWDVMTENVTEHEGNNADTRIRVPAGNVILLANFESLGDCGEYPCICHICTDCGNDPCDCDYGDCGQNPCICDNCDYCGNDPCTCASDLLRDINDAARENDDEAMRDLLDDDRNLDIIDESGDLREEIRDFVPPLTDAEWDRIVEEVRENAPHGDLDDVRDAIRDALREIEDERMAVELTRILTIRPDTVARGVNDITGGFFIGIVNMGADFCEDMAQNFALVYRGNSGNRFQIHHSWQRSNANGSVISNENTHIFTIYATNAAGAALLMLNQISVADFEFVPVSSTQARTPEMTYGVSVNTTSWDGLLGMMSTWVGVGHLTEWEAFTGNWGAFNGNMSAMNVAGETFVGPASHTELRTRVPLGASESSFGVFTILDR